MNIITDSLDISARFSHALLDLSKKFHHSKYAQLDHSPDNISSTSLFISSTSSKDIDKESQVKRIEQLLDKTEILDLNFEASKKSARIAGNLISEEERIEIPDTITAGITLSRGINTIVTRNKDHFERIDGM